MYYMMLMQWFKYIGFFSFDLYIYMGYTKAPVTFCDLIF